MAFKSEQTENLINLLMNKDELNAKLAFEIIENNEFPITLVSELFAFYKTAEDKTLKQKAKNLLEQHGSPEVIDAMNMRYPLKGGKSTVAATEKTIKKNIIQYTHNNELDGIKIAKALYKKIGAGATYLLTATPLDQRKEMLKTFINGTCFTLNNKALTQFPPELFEFPALTEIDLSENKITSIPKKINVFQNLQKLNLSQNKIKSIHKNILALKELVDLDVSKNDHTKSFPTILLELRQLKKLNIIQVRNNWGRYEDMPAEISNLTNLEELYSEISNRPQYANFPSFYKVTGNPINPDPLALAYLAYDQGDDRCIYYIFQHGSEERIRVILNKYYDPTNQTFDFTGIHIQTLPEVIKTFKVKKIIMKNCGIGWYAGSYGHTPEVISRIHRRSLSRTAIFNELTDLESLDLTENNLHEIADISSLKKLTELNLNRNRFGQFPLALTKLPNLKSLSMAGNYNNFMKPVTPTSFPYEMINLTYLETFRVSISGMRNNESYFMERFKKLIPNCTVTIG